VLKILVSLIPVSIEVVTRNLDIGAPLIRFIVILDVLIRLAITLCVGHLEAPVTWLLDVREERRLRLDADGLNRNSAHVTPATSINNVGQTG
jgi:hypothetical protein